jgi:hypothetical protein
MQNKSLLHSIRVLLVQICQDLQRYVLLFIHNIKTHFLKNYIWHDLLRWGLEFESATWAFLEAVMAKILAIRAFFMRRNTSLCRPFI